MSPCPSCSRSARRPANREQRNAAPLARGREIYGQSCLQCHGDQVRGDGPLAKAPRPPPLDLTGDSLLHTESAIMNWLQAGIARTAMPAFKDQCTEEELQAVINDIRELSKRGGP